MDAHTGVSALVCQTLSKSGVHVTALIGGGDGSVEAHESCMANGARGVLTGNPAAVMLSLEEDGWDFVLDTVGGQRVYDAAKRMLKDGARCVRLRVVPVIVICIAQHCNPINCFMIKADWYILGWCLSRLLIRHYH
jgi:D-arabinose 1-dehydrogenase-like Zn-dependent alcohol dehydrogenase